MFAQLTRQTGSSSWVYLVDLTKGFASGFNAPGAEDKLGNFFGESDDNDPIAVASFLPRYYFLNDKAETWNWWIYFFGRNEYAVENSIFYSDVHRKLDGIICDEQENCFSLDIPIPYELNLIDVLPEVTPSIKLANNFPANPAGLGGFAMLDIVEGGTIFLPSISTVFIDGTNNALGLFSIFSPVEYYSAHAWSYQREQSNDGLPNLSWDVIHPQHRIWCSVSDEANGASCEYGTVNP